MKGVRVFDRCSTCLGGVQSRQTENCQKCTVASFPDVTTPPYFTCLSVHDVLCMRGHVCPRYKEGQNPGGNQCAYSYLDIERVTKDRRN